MPILLALFLICATASYAVAVEGAPATDAAMIKADVLYWDGDELVVKEISGHEVRLRVTPETKIVGTAGRLKTGDKIAAQVNSDGHALSITLQIPDIGTSVSPSGVR